jgi:hypothetical protein
MFLKEEGYTTLETDKINIWVKDRGHELLSRSVARMRHFTKDQDQYLKPKMFDRWRKFVQIRKLIRYLLNNIENSLHVKRADLHQAFRRWKKSCYVVHGKKPTWELIKRSAKNSDRLDYLDSIMGQATEFKD